MSLSQTQASWNMSECELFEQWGSLLLLVSAELATGLAASLIAQYQGRWPWDPGASLAF